jgi:uncharacterized coiled-coil DUF342 family protein
MKEFKEDWQLSAAEKENNYVDNLKNKIETASASIDTLHTFYGHNQEEIKALPEDKIQELYERLNESMQKLTEVKNNLENGNPSLVKNKI